MHNSESFSHRLSSWPYVRAPHALRYTSIIIPGCRKPCLSRTLLGSCTIITFAFYIYLFIYFTCPPSPCLAFSTRNLLTANRPSTTQHYAVRLHRPRPLWHRHMHCNIIIIVHKTFNEMAYKCRSGCITISPLYEVISWKKGVTCVIDYYYRVYESEVSISEKIQICLIETKHVFPK